MHPLLSRQLRRLGLTTGEPPETAAAWSTFLDQVNQAMVQSDEDRLAIEHSLGVCSWEMQELNANLRRSSETALAHERDKLARSLDELRRTNRFLDSIVENIPDMVFVKDAEELRFVRFNRAGEELLGMARENLIGKSDRDLFPEDQAEFFIRTDRRVIEEGGVFAVREEPLTTLNGTHMLSTKKIPILDEDGTPLYLLGIARDITQERERAEELKRAKDAAEFALQARANFLANMSHELRTPLNAIVGFSRLLASSPSLTASELRHAEFLTSAAEYMLKLVNDLLDLRRLDEQPLVLAELDAATLVARAVDFVRPMVIKRELSVFVDIPIGALVLAEDTSLMQVLLNLLSNATKFTRMGGSIQLSVSHDEAGLRFSVQDEGPGISPEGLSKLFTYFEQLGAKHEHGMRGSGVGLALTKKLVEKLGGTMDAVSTLGVGSTFGFVLAGRVDGGGQGR